MQLFKRHEVFIFFLVFGSLLWGIQSQYNNEDTLGGDGIRYIEYAVSLHEHETFGLIGADIDVAPTPSNANAPFYPLFITGLMMLHQSFENSMYCIVQNGAAYNENCVLHFDIFIVFQSGLILLSLFLIYLTALRLNRNHAIAWVAALIALCSGVFTEFSNVFMTEIMILPGFCLLIFLCLRFYQEGTWHTLLFIAITLATLTLIRPSYLYLFYGFLLFFTAMLFTKRNLDSSLKLLILLLGFIACVAPWSIRNKIHFDSYALTTNNYAISVLLQRINYNKMSWLETGVAMVYWLPDFGDSLSEKLFPERLYNKLGWNENSYQSLGYGKQTKSLEAKLGGKDKILPYLIKEELLTAKHIAVSIPLALRGSFIGKYWGLAGLISFLALLIQTIKHKEYGLLVISLPIFFMVAFHAGLSVSIPRYNLPLVVIYALSMGHYITLYGEKLVAKIHRA